jgi:N-sulfoglucosamine sulfohydrolase
MMLLLRALALFLFLVRAAAAPDMVIFLADDLGRLDCAPYGATDVRTPHMQRLAEAGMTFDNACVASPGCAPSRAALLTGLMPARNGAEPNHAKPRAEVKKWPAYFQALGYEVVAFGKVAHYKHTADYGFDRFAHDTFHDHAGIGAAGKFLKNRPRTGAKPLCLFVGSNWPHVPWPEQSDYDRAALKLPAGSVDTPATREWRARYAAAVTKADNDLGAVMDAARAHLPPETLFVFSSDHGAQWPFGKWNLYESGVAVPLLVAWPGTVKPNTRTAALVQWTDLLPTLLAAAGGTPSENLDGRSFLPVLRGDTAVHHARLFTTHSGDGNMNVYPMRAVREGQWKYIRNLHPEFEYHTHIDADTGRLAQRDFFSSWRQAAKTDAAAQAIVKRYHERPAEELYDLAADPHEQRNLIGKPEQAKRLVAMRRSLDDWMRAQGDAQKVYGDPKLPGKLPAVEPSWFLELKTAYNTMEQPARGVPMPPVEARFPSSEYNDFGETRFRWSGVSIVWDGVNGEALFLCGHNGGMPFGDMGSWATRDGGKTWRELKWASPVLDPLRQLARKARQPAKQAEGLARAIFYAAHDTAHEARLVRDKPAKLVVEAQRLAEDILRSLDMAGSLDVPPIGASDMESLKRAGSLMALVTAALDAAGDAFSAGRLDTAALRACFDAQWALDAAADCLASSPPPRERAAAVFDPASGSVILFGGSHHDFMYNDTWRYDCAKQTWRQLWPKTAPTARMGAVFSIAGGKLTLSGGETVLDRMVYQKGEKPAPAGEWTFDIATGEWTGEGGAPPGTRIYRTVVPVYDPRWYDAAPRGNRTETEAWLAALKPNTWTAVPAQPAPAPERDWGNAVFDPDRDCIYRWTGGHCADPASQPSTYHPAINRWSIPFVPDIIAARKGMTFTGRPDCANHTYLHAAYDAVSRRLICPSHGGTGVFDPDTGDFEFSVPQPFNRHIYETCAIGTPRGVMLWARGGRMFLFDCAAREWRPFAVTGKVPAPVTDGSAFCCDTKRDALWMASFHGYQKPSGNIWRLDLKTGVVTAMNPSNAATLGMAKGFHSEIRESIYLPPADLVLFNNFTGGRQIAYDPNANRWVTLDIPQNLERLGTVSDTLTWDGRRGLVWNLNAYKAIYVLRPEAATLGPRDR